jgi:hypothetical protein
MQHPDPSRPTPQRQVSDRLRHEIGAVREMMFTVHYFAEASWLVAAVEFPALCHSETARDALRSAARIAWQFGYPSVTHWLNTDVLGGATEAGAATEHTEPAAPPLTDPI